MIETSLCVTSYNRPGRLREVLSSFFRTNLYDLSKLELIIVDNGSTSSDVTDFIKNYSPNCKYRYTLNEKNDYPNCLRYSKIQARELANGKYFIDCPDDHIFVAKVPWIEECINRINSEPTVGCINHYAFPRYRFRKKNNMMSIDKDNPNFSVSTLKGYSDFHIMSKETYKKIGKYEYTLGRSAEGEYMERSLEMGYFRNLMMNPIAVCMDGGKYGEGKYGFGLIEPIEERDYRSNIMQFFKRSYYNDSRSGPTPVHNEALIQYCIENSHIKVKKQ